MKLIYQSSTIARIGRKENEYRLKKVEHLVNLLNSRSIIMTSSTTGSASARESAGTREPSWTSSTWHAAHTSRHPTFSTTIHLYPNERLASYLDTNEKGLVIHYGVSDTFQTLLLCLVLLNCSGLVVVEPCDSLVNLGLKFLLIARIKLLVNFGI